MISAKGSDAVTSTASAIAVNSWYCLLGAIILFLMLKIHMIAHAFLLHEKTEFLDKNYQVFNAAGWFWGIIGFSSFIWGLVQLVRAVISHF